MAATRVITATEARRIAVSAQGLAGERPSARVSARRLAKTVAALGVLQLDAISVLQRTQFLVLFSRVGPYDTALLHELSAPGGELFECAGYRAGLMPMLHQPLVRWRAAYYGAYNDSPTHAARWEAYHRANAGYIDAVLREVAERGPLAASQLSDPRRRSGEWWERRSDGRRALEVLFNRGDLAAWRTPRFERVYDLPERVIPEAVLRSPTPGVDEAQRELLRMAARALGVATVADLAGYHLLKRASVKARVEELVEEGHLLPVEVEGWRDPAYLDPAASADPPGRPGGTLLSPFDSLIWDRSRARRLFGFDYRIEVYVPQPKRRFGYYVLPLLVGDRLVGRFDLKADRRRSTLVVAGSYSEPGTRATTVARAAAGELRAMSEWLGLPAITVEPRGDLAGALSRTLRTRR